MRIFRGVLSVGEAVGLTLRGWPMVKGGYADDSLDRNEETTSVSARLWPADSNEGITLSIVYAWPIKSKQDTCYYFCLFQKARKPMIKVRMMPSLTFSYRDSDKHREA
jgi:hypothetical protein